jgi:hypothetical protein
MGITLGHHLRISVLAITLITITTITTIITTMTLLIKKTTVMSLFCQQIWFRTC